jgi:hypothetical protein
MIDAVHRTANIAWAFAPANEYRLFSAQLSTVDVVGIR